MTRRTEWRAGSSQCGRFHVPSESFGRHAANVAFRTLISCKSRGRGLVDDIDSWRSSVIIAFAFFLVVGLAAGFILRLPAFAIFWFLVVAAYAVFRHGVGGAVELTYHVLFVGIALQIGYFLAIVIQALRPSGTTIALRSNRKNAGGDSNQER